MTAAGIEAPVGLRETYCDWRWSVAWQHASGIVHRLEHDGEVRFLKLTCGPRALRTLPEAERMRWARRYVSVPEVLDVGSEGGVDWLVTRALPGRDGVSPELLASPSTLVQTLGRGLRRFHDALPVADCPFDFRLDAALAQVHRRAEAGLILPDEDFQYEYEGIGLAEALRRVETERPPSEDLVVCHGDYCFPNVLIEDGEVTGYIDLGELGMADRWFDLAVATWSTIWNVGPGYEDLFLQAYGIERDDARIAYYRLLASMAR